MADHIVTAGWGAEQITVVIARGGAIPHKRSRMACVSAQCVPLCRLVGRKEIREDHKTVGLEERDLGFQIIGVWDNLVQDSWHLGILCADEVYPKFLEWCTRCHLVLRGRPKSWDAPVLV